MLNRRTIQSIRELRRRTRLPMGQIVAILVENAVRQPLALTWACVDWDRCTIRVPSPKTRHHPGHESRIVPLFPELRAEIEALFAVAEATSLTSPVIARYRSASCNLRTQLGRIAKRAGIALWPKPWTNMRATRDAELRRDYPAHVVRQWVGHTERVAQEHYLLASDESYIRQASSPEPKEKSEAKCEAVPAHQASAHVVSSRAPDAEK